MRSYCFPPFSFLLFAFLSVCGCGGVAAESPGCVVPSSSTPLSDDELKSVAITSQKNANILAGADFSLSRTLGQILQTAKAAGAGSGDSPDNRKALLQTLLATMKETSFRNPLPPNIQVPVEVRPSEANLDPDVLLGSSTTAGSMRVVGLFNRLDQAPADWKYCGEHRIIYEKDTSAGGRLTLIFEAALSNPYPNLGAQGCLAAARFWDALKAKPDQEAANALAAFYYNGVDGLEPVVQFTHYGIAFGQVRANLFVGGLWQLREWHVATDASSQLKFVAVPVGTNPLNSLFKAANPADDPVLSTLRTDFQQQFVDQYAPQLLQSQTDAASTGKTVDESDFIFTNGYRPDAKFFGFQSNSQDSSDDFGTNPSQDLVSKLGILLDQSNIPNECRPTPQQVLDRAGSQSCAGCHELSNGKSVANNVSWPNSSGFVHLDESGSMSQLLRDRFLPSRSAALQRFLTDHKAERVPRARPAPNHKDYAAVQRNAVKLRRQDRLQEGALVKNRPGD